MTLKVQSNLRFLLAVCVFGLMPLSACKSALLGEAAFVVPETAEIRNSTSKASRSIGNLKRGDEVTIIGKSEEAGETYAHINAAGTDGWVIARNLMTKANAEKSKAFAASLAEIPAQAICKNKSSLKLRLTPERISDSNVIVQLPAGLSFEIVDRETHPKTAEKTATPAPAAASKSGADKPKDEAADYEIWYKVRLVDNPLVPGGYVYAGSVEFDVPYEIQYFSQPDKKIIGWQKLGAVKDERGEDHYHYAIFQKTYNTSDEKSDFDYVHIVGFDPKNKSVSYYNVLRETRRGTFPVRTTVEGARASVEFSALDANNQTTPVRYIVEPNEKGRLRATPPDGNLNLNDPRRK